MTPEHIAGNENCQLGLGAEQVACERYPMERVPDDHHDEWWLDARVAERIDVGDGFGTVERGTPVEVKSAAWRIQNGTPRRGRWYLRRRSHRRLREADGEYVLLVEGPNEREIAGYVLRPAWWVEDLITTWSPTSTNDTAQIPWSRAFDEGSTGKGIALSGLPASEGSA